MLLRKKNGLNFTPQDFFDSHVCNLNLGKMGRTLDIMIRVNCTEGASHYTCWASRKRALDKAAKNCW